MKIRQRDRSYEVVELEHGDQVKLLVPASEERTCVYLEVNCDGQLCIIGGASIISQISGEGMRGKIKN